MASMKNARKVPTSKDDKDAQVRQRILAAFSSRARRDGIRAVMMSELSSQLRMSMVTLYKHFPSKDDLVAATVDEWVRELAALDALAWQQPRSARAALAGLLEWSTQWTAIMTSINPAFFEDLRREYPASWQRLRAQVAERKRAYMPNLVSLLKPDINPVASLRLLDRMVMAAVDPRFLREAGIPPREAVRTALAVWGSGALQQRVSTRPRKTNKDS